MSKNIAQPLTNSAISHGWIRPLLHPELGVEVNGQSVVRYLRFAQQVQVDRLELSPLPAGRWIPTVPSHPAHITVSLLDAGSGCWQVIKDVNLPCDPRISGEPLNQHMTIAEMDEILRPAFDIKHIIELDGITCDMLRVECDREHPVWQNHGECNGAPYFVPLGVLDSLTAFGTGESEISVPEYLPALTIEAQEPVAPAGMTVELLPWQVKFSGDKFSVAFSLIRPEILHLGWDGTDSGRAGENRCYSRTRGFSALFNGQCGPVLRTACGDFAANCWSGRVSVEENKVHYRDISCGQGITLDLTFTIDAEGFQLDITQHVAEAQAVVEFEAWRLAWNCAEQMTAAAAVPTLNSGRNGEVQLPMYWAGDGNGALSCELIVGDAYLQVESYRALQSVCGGIMLGKRPDSDSCLMLPAGTSQTSWRFNVTAFAPISDGVTDEQLPPAIRQHWGSQYCCYRPEYGGFSNNALSVNCHVNQHAPSEIVAFTRQPENGPDPLEMHRFTIARALLGGGGYGYYRNLYLDSDPILISAAGRIHQARPETEWLQKIEPGLIAATERVLSTLGYDGLAICRDLSGNSGSYRWSSNAMDVVGFGHMDSYVNAWTYRGLRNAAPMVRLLGCDKLSDECSAASEYLRSQFAHQLINPQTGWVAGWRSRDGKLHDAAYLWVNGVAIAFGLLDAPTAQNALRGLENLRQQVGAGRAFFGIPFNLLPIASSDHMLPLFHGHFTPSFENYTDGAMASCAAPYYLRALARYGFNDEAAQITRDLEEGYVRGHFNGGIGSGVEFIRWDGVPCGYEGSFVNSWQALYAIAIERGIFAPTDPEWWPAG